jgi:membrane-associated phospholipid phosphatase
MDNIIIFGASYLYLVILALAAGVFLLADRPTKWRMVKLAVVAFPVIYLVGLASGSVISSPRPFVVQHIQPLIHSDADNGFPSDHTLLSMAVAGVVLAYSRRWGIALLLLAALVGTARVLAHVHHPIDIVGSTVIALSITFLVYHFVVNRILPNLFAENPTTSRGTSKS